MAEFQDIQDELGTLSRTMSNDLGGREVVETITVPPPTGVKDELYFNKLVAWSYVALVEAFPVPLKQLSNVLRATNSEGHRRLVETKDVVQALRTVQSHNLAKKTPSNERQRLLTEAWFVSNGGSQLSWETCCTALCTQVLEALRSLRVIWVQLTANDDDSTIFLTRLLEAINSEWPAHTFDTAVADAASALGFTDFDVVAYRQTRIEHWRKLAAFFPDREVATQAMERAITQELSAIFGSS